MTGTSSVCQFYDSPRQLICFCRTKFRVREADLLKSIESSKTVPMVCQDCPDRIAIHKQLFRQTHCFTYIVDIGFRYSLERYTILVSIEISIPACHAGDRRGVRFPN
jgi:hypothetical protein